jgi:hypothetical protein
MAILKGKPRYRLGGDLSLADADGFPRHFSIGDEMPDDVLARLCKGEIDSMLGIGMLREIGAPPPPKATPEPVRPLTVLEILRSTEAWPRASLEDGQIVGGPKGCTITVLDKTARDGDLKQVLATGRETPVVVHRVDGEWVATLSLMHLASVLAVARFGVV